MYWVLAVLLLLRGLIDEGLDGGDFGVYIDELVLDDLELRYRLPESHAVACVFRRVVEHCLRARDRARGGDHALALQLPHQVLETLALLADEVGRRHAAVLEDELCGV